MNALLFRLRGRRAARRARPALASLVHHRQPVHPGSVHAVDRSIDTASAMLALLYLMRRKRLRPRPGTACPHCGHREFYGDCPARRELLQAQVEVGQASCAACERLFVPGPDTLYALFEPSDAFRRQLDSDYRQGRPHGTVGFRQTAAGCQLLER